MGSSQSSSSQATTDNGSFSIDPSGNIKRKINVDSANNRQQWQTTGEQSSQQQDQPISAPVTPLNEPQSYIVGNRADHHQSSAVTGDNYNNGESGLDLNEVDDVLTRMKNKYKPHSLEMSGKKDSVFEEVERNLVECYKTNKNQPMNCSKLSNHYRDYVNQQRSEILKQKLAKNGFNSRAVPLITTTSILVLITCLLLHITTVCCFGAMSIDLGSEWMKVGLVAPSVQMDIVLNAGSQRKTPMAVAFSNGERFIGDTALDIASKYPEKAFTHFLDLVGKTIEDKSVEHYKQRFPYADITSHQPNSTSILLNHPEGFELTPLELIAMMIQHAHDQVVNRLNSYEPANDCVITVPPFFNEAERNVIKEAAKLVGLNVLRLTNVNSAFALSYGIFRHKDYQPESAETSNRTSILFFDQGASHTSATLADYHLVEQFDERTNKNETLPTISIRAQVYDRFLGGFDMQLKLRDYLISEFAKKTKIDESKIHKRGRSVAKLLKESGRVKKVLSANLDHVVRVENVIDDLDMKQPISRQEFEELNQEYFGERITQLLDKLFEMPDVNREDPLNSIIIVGGNTRTPRIQQVLIDYFKVDSLGKAINADEGAALAALYQAASLGRGFRVKKFVLEEFGEKRKRFDPSVASPATPQTPVEGDSSGSTEAPVGGTTTTTEASADPDSIYSEAELERIKKRLSQMREEDFLRLQRMSLKNSLESLLSEGREKLSDDENNDEHFKERRDEIKRLVTQTSVWLEDGPQIEVDNVTTLAEKYRNIHELIHPPPPPPPPPTPKFDPTTVDLSSVFGNETLNILNKLNLTGENVQENLQNISMELEQDQVEVVTELPHTSTTTTPGSTTPETKSDPHHSEL